MRDLDRSQGKAHTYSMTLADKVTASRIILAPIFFAFYFLSEYFLPFAGTWTVPVLWALFTASELSDLLDGRIARRRNEVGDFGKLFDPFADVLVRISYFLCFVVAKVLPPWPFLLILYREFGILFLRILMMKKGVAMGARRGGKLKAVLYMIAGGGALLSIGLGRLGFNFLAGPVRLAAEIVFYASALISLLSFADYIMVYRKAPQQ